MFSSAAAFNQGIGAWDVSSVTDIREMFRSSDFNQDISAWDVSSVTNMSLMFGSTFYNHGASFNQDIGVWDVSSVIDMSAMFSASNFNQDISAWDVSSVTDMSAMFSSTSGTTQGLPAQQRFFQDISGWDVSSVINMTGMFYAHYVKNYDVLLNTWSNLPLSSNINFNAGYSQYSPSSQAARDILTNTYGWEITNGGVTP